MQLTLRTGCSLTTSAYIVLWSGMQVVLMTRRQYVIVARHGLRRDEVDSAWAATSKRPWDPPLADGAPAKVHPNQSTLDFIPLKEVSNLYSTFWSTKVWPHDCKQRSIYQPLCRMVMDAAILSQFRMHLSLPPCSEVGTERTSKLLDANQEA